MPPKVVDYPPQITEQLKQVDQLTDRLGNPVDEEIKLLVAALRAHNFNTDDSCEGHDSRRTGGPRVSITSSETARIEQKLRQIDFDSDEAKQLSRQLELTNLHDRARLLDLLTYFYDRRQIDAWVQIVVENRGYFSSNVLICQGTKVVDSIEPDDMRREWLILAKKEFADFAEYLINRLADNQPSKK